eukprot:TRINITY_DN6518_c0_g1_i2.p1 TRINITY_DN6518_c0_g1~~TRINITY_DN6518_c0_g1_i2.p1  ORF type:complete len:518 (+),score=136.62 TRINITY_DN6518_c0_g1_i2:223-1776(+)
MFKPQSSRNPRNVGGFKVKLVLHICLLLAVCVWLIYQVGHSYYKKKAFDDGNQKSSEKVQNRPEVLNFGRKDLNDPGIDKAYGDENKQVSIEDERREGGDDETDERDQEKDKEEAERINEEFKENEKRVSQIEDANSQEAREEQYNGDDASNGVNKDAQLIIKSESENGDSSNSDKEQGQNIENSDDSSNQTKDGFVDRNDENSVNGKANIEEKGSTEVNLSESEDGSRRNLDTESINQMEEKGSTEVSLSESDDRSRHNSNPESIDQMEEKGSTDGSLSESDDRSRRNLDTESNDHVEENSSTNVILSELEDGSRGNLDTESNNQIEEYKNSKETAESPDSSLQNQTTSLDFVQDRNETIETEIFNADKSNLQAVKLEEKMEISYPTSMEDGSVSSTNNTMSENTESPNLSLHDGTASPDFIQAQNGTDSDEDKNDMEKVVVKEHTDNSNTTPTAEESVDSSVSSITTSENGDMDQGESSGTSSSLVTQEEKEAPKDLGILPEGENGVKNGEDVSV